jgi:hypothetical protein
MPILGTDNFNFANILINQSSNYVSTDYIYVNQKGTWATVDNVYKKINGTWAQIWPTTGVVVFDQSTTVKVPPGIKYADILVIGGGGGGGQGLPNHNGGAGGGGAGGVVFEEAVPVVTGTTYNIVIGQGGSAAASNSGNGGGDGGDTSISGCVSGAVVTYKAYGGTGGSGYYGPHGPGSGCCCSGYVTKPYIGPGGSGGGGYSAGDARGVSPPTPGGPQGYAGGYGATNNSIDAGGGGGGAGGAGDPAAVGIGGAGGIGALNNITGQCTYYAGGGGGGATNPGSGVAGTGGQGGGGNGGQDATGYGGGGGGGGAGGDSGVGPNSGNGHHGAVIINFYTQLGGKVKLEVDSGTGRVNVPTGSEISYGQGSSSGGCFLEYTMVMLHDGRLVPISEIQIGDLVWNHDHTEINKVTMVERINALHLGALYSPNPDLEPFATVNHPLYIDGKLSSVDPEKIAEYYPWLPRTKLINTKNIIPARDQLVYNLWVTGDGTYTVNGYGTTSIIGDGGSMTRFVRKGQFTPEIASETVLKVSKAGSDTSAGGKYLNDLAGRLNWPIIDWLFVRGFATDRYPGTQRFLMMVFNVTGKIIKRFR